MNGRALLRLAGLAGVLAAVAWIVGDVLLVGHVANAADYPWLAAHADRVDADMVLRLLGVPVAQLAAGALCAVFSVPLYLCGCWHLWRGLRGSGRAWSLPAIALVFVGYALSPLPHAAFYYLGAVYQSLLTADASAHPALLALADAFHRVLLVTWLPAVLCQMLGMLWLSLAIASGRSAWPRWMAITANPIVLGMPIAVMPHLFPVQPWLALGAASFNVMWLAVYLQCLCLFRPARANPGAAGP